MPRTKRSTPITSDNPAIAGPRAPADRLYRATAECVRQRQRYSALVEAGASDDEQRAALNVASLCDAILSENIAAFETASSGGFSKDENWYRKAILVWQASREYARRHRSTDVSTKKLGGPEGLNNLALEYDLEASALLALQHALSSYRKTVPDAHIEATSTRLP